MAKALSLFDTAPENPAYPKPQECVGCPAYDRPGPVWAYGPKDAESLFVGEAPGKREVRATVQPGDSNACKGTVGKPFIGEAGWQFESLCKFTGIDRAKVRIANAVACLPPPVVRDGKTTYPVTRTIAEHCRKHWEQLLGNDPTRWPRHVHSMGSWAARRWFGSGASIDSLQGTVVRFRDMLAGNDPQYDDCKTVLTFSLHPARILPGRDIAARPVVSEQFKRAARIHNDHGGLEPRRRPLEVVDLDDHSTRVVAESQRNKWNGVLLRPASACPHVLTIPTDELKYLILDVETTERVTDPRNAKLARIGIGTNAWGAVTGKWTPEFGKWIQQIIDAVVAAGGWIGAHNLPFDYIVSKYSGGLDLRITNAFDTMIAMALLFPDLPNRLEFCAMMAKKADHVAWKHLSDTDEVVYNGLDVAEDAILLEWVIERLKHENLWDEFTYSMRTLPVVLEAFEVGLRIDQEARQETRAIVHKQKVEFETTFHEKVREQCPERVALADTLNAQAKVLRVMAERSRKARRDEVRAMRAKNPNRKSYPSENTRESKSLVSKAKKLEAEAEKSFSVNFKSPKQLAKLFFEDMGLERKYATGTSRTTTNKQALEELHEVTNNPVLLTLIEMRRLDKIENTFLGEKQSGGERMHFQVNIARNSEFGGEQTSEEAGSRTGRWSMKPSPQVMPEELRHIWIPDKDDYAFLYRDWSSAEIYAIAYMTGKVTNDWTMWEYVKGGGDLYTRFAAHHLQKSPEDVTADERQMHKRYALGLNYGMGAKKFAMLQGCTIPEAKVITQAYLGTFPALKVFREWVVEKAKTDRVLRNPFGRLRWFPDESMAPEALNFMPQTIVNSMLIRATAQIEDALCSSMTELKQKGWRQCLWIHDAIILNGPREYIEEADMVMDSVMSQDWGPKMPGFFVPSDAKVGVNLRPLSKDNLKLLRAGQRNAWNGRDLVDLDLWLQHEPSPERAERRVA